MPVFGVSPSQHRSCSFRRLLLLRLLGSIGHLLRHLLEGCHTDTHLGVSFRGACPQPPPTHTNMSVKEGRPHPPPPHTKNRKTGDTLNRRQTQRTPKARNHQSRGPGIGCLQSRGIFWLGHETPRPPTSPPQTKKNSICDST